jgi:hypothetical protein
MNKKTKLLVQNEVQSANYHSSFVILGNTIIFFSSPCQCQINLYPTTIAQNNLIPQSNHNYLQPTKIQLLESLSNLYVVNNLSFGQFIITLMIRSKLSTSNLQCLRVVNIPAKLNTHSISIYDLEIPNICLARKLTFGNRVS